MAGKVESLKLNIKKVGFWRTLTCLFFFSSSLICLLLISGCNETLNEDDLANITPTEKKTELKKSLDRRFENPQAHYLLGQLYHAERDWPNAEYHYNTALRFDPVHRPAQAAMVKLFLDRGETMKAANYLEIYMNQVGDSPDQLLELALEFQKQDLDNYALNCFEKALAVAPNSSKVHKYLGYFYLEKNNKIKAEDHFVLSYELNNKQPDVAYELGRLGVQVQIPRQSGANPVSIN